MQQTITAKLSDECSNTLQVTFKGSSASKSTTMYAQLGQDENYAQSIIKAAKSAAKSVKTAANPEMREDFGTDPTQQAILQPFNKTSFIAAEIIESLVQNQGFINEQKPEDLEALENAASALAPAEETLEAA